MSSPRRTRAFALLLALMTSALAGVLVAAPAAVAAPVTVAAAPDAPVLTATAGLGVVHLTWTVPADGGAAITNYKISRSTATGTEIFLADAGNVTLFDDTPLVGDGTTYFYTVSAENADGPGVPSNEVSAIPTSTAPNAPALAASPMLGGLHLTWTAPNANASPITNYRIYRSTTTGNESFLVEVGNVTSHDDTSLVATTTYFYTVTAVNGVGEGPLSNEVFAAPIADPTGEFHPLAPERVLDTRTDPAINCPANDALTKLGDGASFDVKITGCANVPTTAQAVVVNVTVANPNADSFLTVRPAAVLPLPLPDISNLNYLPGQIVPNLVTVALGTDGKVNVFNKHGTVDVIVDVVGYYAGPDGDFGSRFHGVEPSRAFDTRDGEGGVPIAQIGPAGVLAFKVTGHNLVPDDPSVTAVVMNVTVVGATTSSFLTVYPDGVGPQPPVASNLNFVSASPIPNLVVVQVPASGIVDFYNKRGFTHVLADVVGYYDTTKDTNAGRFVAVTPVRRIDTRLFSPFSPPGKIPAGFALLARLPGSANSNLPSAGVGSVVLNVTATEPTADGFLTVYPADASLLPFVSNLNFVAGQTVANLVMVKVSAGPPSGGAGAGWLGFYNKFGATHVIADVFGYFTASSPGVTGASVEATDNSPLLAVKP